VLFIIGGTVAAEFLRHDALGSLPIERSDDGKEGRADEITTQEVRKEKKERRAGGHLYKVFIVSSVAQRS